MTQKTIITSLPIGELDSDRVRSELTSILAVLKNIESDLYVADPVADEEAARRSMKELSKRNSDFFLIIPLRGLSAQVIEAALLESNTLCMIRPVQGRFALPSSALAIGAMQESKTSYDISKMQNS